jgi:GNAT superfamily N-acetyltransferase
MASPSLSPDSPVVIRPARLADAPAFASLATQLGYPSSPRQVEERLAKLLEDAENLLLAAAAGGRVVGWAHAYVCYTVESDTFAELGGLVVDESHRGRGVGGMLMRQVDDWARQKGCCAVSARSNIIRHKAHKFYAAEGYDQIKTQYVFRKRL